MAVLLGDNGRVELRRSASSSARSTIIGFKLNVADINDIKNRFSFTPDRGGAHPLLSGDRVSIKSAGVLSWITTYSTKNEFTGYVHVDAAGGIYLYHDYLDSINGELTNRLSLDATVSSADHTVKLEESPYKILGQVVRYELNTEREAVDTTSLSDDFRRSTSGLISGSGRLTALFDYRRNGLDPSYEGITRDRVELPFFISQLVLRTELGSEFNGRFFVVAEGNKAYGTSETKNDTIWYECDARVTSAAMDFTASTAIELTVEFVTTGKITLQTDFDSPGKVLTAVGGALMLGLYQNTGPGAITKNTP